MEKVRDKVIVPIVNIDGNPFSDEFHTHLMNILASQEEDFDFEKEGEGHLLGSLKRIPEELTLTKSVWEKKSKDIFVNSLMSLWRETRLNEKVRTWTADVVRLLSPIDDTDCNAVEKPIVKDREMSVEEDWFTTEQIEAVTSELKSFDTPFANAVRGNLEEILVARDRLEDKVRFVGENKLADWFYFDLSFILRMAEVCEDDGFHPQVFEKEAGQDGFEDNRDSVNPTPMTERVRRIEFILSTCNLIKWDAGIKNEFEIALIRLTKKRELSVKFRVELARLIVSMTRAVKSPAFVGRPVVDNETVEWFPLNRLNDLLETFASLVNLDSTDRMNQLLSNLRFQISVRTSPADSK